MDKYTIEQLRTEGTDLNYLRNKKIFTSISEYEYKLEEKELIYGNLVSFGSKIINEKEHILVEDENYICKRYYEIPISEFKRLGMLKSEEKKYTVDYLKNNKVAVKVNNEEQIETLINIVKPSKVENWRRYFSKDCDWFVRLDDSHFDFAINSAFWKGINNYKIIDYQTFIEHNKQEKTMNEKPQTFKILGKEHQLKAIWQDLMDMGYEKGVGSDWTSIAQLYFSGKDFKKLTHNGIENANLDITFNLPQDYSKALEHAQKCLELLKPKEITHSVGGKFDVKIKDGKIYHNSDDITEFVEKLNNYFVGEKWVGNYKFKTKEVEFEYTGCQKTTTKLSDWVELWNKYKETNGKD